jgi:XTP/dITP diphosphohydrolase
MPPLPARIVLASGNPGKLREIQRILDEFGVRVEPQSVHGVQDADETGTSFEANALLKARHAMRATGLAAIADDSGLAVDALDGRPGVYSSRYAGKGASDVANNALLLRELDGVPADRRTAAFHCVACFVTPDDEPPLLARGLWRGRILSAPRGNGGFGYDPLFFVPSHGCSSAELDAADKDRLSHRGQALRELARRLRERQ